MKDQLISFETAILAGKHGFEKSWCELAYRKDDKQLYGDTGMYTDYPAPTQSLLQSWFRDEHDIDTGLYYWDDGTYSYRISELIGINNLIYHTDNVFIGTYEQTLEHALIKALKILE